MTVVSGEPSGAAVADGATHRARRPGAPRRTLLRTVLRRLLTTVALLLIVTALTFLLISIAPGDAAQEILGPDSTQEAYDALRQRLGLDLPVYQQYWNWLSAALHGDLGASLFSGRSVTDLINERVPVTVSLLAAVLIVTTIVGVGLGVVSAVRGGVLGRLVDGLSLIGLAVPSFWAGAILIAVFAVKLRWFPAIGYVPLGESPWRWAVALALPVAALSLDGVAMVAKQTREVMLDVLGSEYIRMARANGISPRSLTFRHALKNSAIRIVTVVSLRAVALLGGTVVVESVFSVPGLGFQVVNSTQRSDVPVVLGLVVYFTIIVVVINLVVDVSYRWLNPKVSRS
ncbi:ABC transporter permease [Pseudonocardia sp. GCM10023141]|uniref:ABC transporter permease n=1 Tax=Pseudonocardia sp. GCM10023141 TaxID=3252653 RepID=UPI00361906E1